MIGTSLYFLQEKLFFFPTVLEENYVYEFNYGFEELNLIASDGAKLNAVHFKVENPKGVILYFHGNAGDLQRWGTIGEYFVEKNYDLLIMDYRTYGKSSGKLSEAVFYSDAQLFYEYLKGDYNESDITLYGRSLGTGIATYVAGKNNPKQLILETPYYSILDVAKHRFPMLPIEKLLQYKFPSYKFIKDVECPITIFHGTDDGIVPYASGRKLFTAASLSKTTFVTIQNGDHNNLIEFDLYHTRINEILL
ncbi:alpha/beta hydrolase [Changchengzhania lutea]|uniref:alpha/beta hydrolase n=1 Tax=Changchengzhania lutea TaxID=2049305 RepID=UPI001FEA15B1|nr:alpha/beta hydrolase [Changchengzhania lutea]